MAQELKDRVHHEERWKIDPNLSHEKVVALVNAKRTHRGSAVGYKYDETTGDLVLSWDRPNDRTTPVTFEEHRRRALAASEPKPEVKPRMQLGDDGLWRDQPSKE